MESFGTYERVTDAQGDPDVKPLEQGTEIQACRGTHFGYELTITGFTPGSTPIFRKVVKYPEMLKADGSVSTGYQSDKPGVVRRDGSVSTYQGFGLDHDYELVLGAWTIEFWYGAQRLASKTFTLVPCRSS